MTKIKVGIVEDELLIARSISMALDDLGYTFTEASISYTEAMKMIEMEKPDILLLDIQLCGKKDGVDVASIVNDKYHIPFIFLTANSDSATIERAKKVNPHAYLIKPFTKEELFASIEIAFNNYQQQMQHKLQIQSPKSQMNLAIFVRENHSFHKILVNEILYIESEENYVRLHTTHAKRIMIRSTFTDFLAQLPMDMFFRTGRSHAVHLDHIEKINPTEIHLAGHRIPVSKTYRDDLFLRLGIK